MWISLLKHPVALTPSLGLAVSAVSILALLRAAVPLCDSVQQYLPVQAENFILWALSKMETTMCAAVNNLTCYIDPLLSSSPESPSQEFVGSLEELLSSLNGNWSPPGGNTRRVCIVDDRRSSADVACPDWSFFTVGSDGSVESVPLCVETQNFGGVGQISPTMSVGTVKALPTDEEKILVKQMLADALASQGQPSLPPDKKMPDTPVANSPASVSTDNDSGNDSMDMSAALPVAPIQVTGQMLQCEEVVSTQKPSPLATLSTWLNSVSKPRLAVKPKRLKQHSVRPHPYAQAKTDSVCHSKSSDMSAPAPVPARTVPPDGQSRVSPAQYVSVICRVDN